MYCEDLLLMCMGMTRISMESLGPWPVPLSFHPKLIPEQCAALGAYKWTLQALSPGSLQTLHNRNVANLPRANCMDFCATPHSEVGLRKVAQAGPGSRLRPFGKTF